MKMHHKSGKVILLMIQWLEIADASSIVLTSNLSPIKSSCLEMPVETAHLLHLAIECP
jgi:hypothetical protein